MDSRAQSGGAVWLYRVVRAHLRGGRAAARSDEASATMASYVVGASVFIIGSAFLFTIALTPPKVEGLDAADSASKAGNVLDILLGTTGYPAEWNASTLSPDRLTRLGLLEAGSSSRIDPAKFRAVSGGSLDAVNWDDDRVDYTEAKLALGLDGYDFHIRAFPTQQLGNAANRGVIGMQDFSVAYIGDFTNGIPSAAATAERALLAQFDIDFTNTVRTVPTEAGSVFRDDATQLRTALVPVIGVGVPQSVINGGSAPKSDFQRVAGSVLETHLPLQLLPKPNMALALTTDGSALEYGKNRELRAFLGVANLSGLSTATVTWKEHVNAGDAGDYGYVEVSPDGGATWYPLTNGLTTRSQDSPLAPHVPAGGYRLRTTSLSAANCAPCMGASEVHVALHWVADNDNQRGSGWIVDDFAITEANFLKTFEEPAFDLLVIGSDVDQNALTSAEVKHAIRDFVEVYGGRILVLGGQQNINWLQPLFHVATRDSATGVGTPDTTHPLLTVPNELDYSSYEPKDKVWDLGGQSTGLFQKVVGTGDAAALAVTIPDAFGTDGANGAIILTTYLPYKMSTDEGLSFFANALVYGKYAQLYIDYGPEVPVHGSQVAAARRTATMDATVDGSQEFVDMSIIVYVWPGDYVAAAVAEGTAKPSAPREPVVTSTGNGTVSLAWSTPLLPQTPAVTGYHVYRGTMAGAATLHAYVAAPDTTFTDTGLVNGVTYHYNVTAVNPNGQGFSSRSVDATPAAEPHPPEAPNVIGYAGRFEVSWLPPTTGGAAITNYSLRVTGDGGDRDIDVGLTNSYSFTDINISPSETWTFRIAANNTKGMSAWSAARAGTSLGTPPALTGLAATSTVEGIQLTWATGIWSTSAFIAEYDVDGYRILRGGTSGGPYTLLATFPTGNLTWHDRNVAPGATYHYVIVAYNDDGQGAHSNEATGMRPSLAAPPIATAMPGDGAVGRVNLTIPQPADLGGSPAALWYHIYRAKFGESLVLAHNATSNGTITHWNDTGLDPGAIYEYRFATGTAAGTGSTGPTSTIVTASALANPPVLGATSLPGHVVLSWTATSATHPATGYKIYRNTTLTDYALLATIGTNTTYSDFTGGANILRSYRVVATNALGDSGNSNTATGTNIGAPLPPTLLATTGTGARQVQLTITPGAGSVTNYTIDFRADGVATWTTITPNATYTGTPQTYVHTAPNALTLYHYRVTANNGAGSSAPSLTASAFSRAMI